MGLVVAKLARSSWRTATHEANNTVKMGSGEVIHKFPIFLVQKFFLFPNSPGQDVCHDHQGFYPGPTRSFSKISGHNVSKTSQDTGKSL